jgi:hypothetical protein
MSTSEQQSIPEPEDHVDDRAPYKRTGLSTVLFGLLMLGLGFVLGFIGRGAVTPVAPKPMARATSLVVGGAVTPTPNTADQAARRTTLMNAVVAQARHFKGDPNAPVTLIEFSDFQ